MTDDSTALLLEILEARSDPLLIRIDEDDCIVAAHWGVGSEHCLGILLRHSEGEIDIGVDPPTRDDYYASLIDDFAGMLWSEKRESLSDDYIEDERLPDDESRMSNWLAETITDHELENWMENSNLILSQGLPGSLIWASLDESKAKELGLEQVDLGGPASSVPMIKFSGNPDKLQAVLVAHRIPLRLVFGIT